MVLVQWFLEECIKRLSVLACCNNQMGLAQVHITSGVTELNRHKTDQLYNNKKVCVMKVKVNKISINMPK